MLELDSSLRSNKTLQAYWSCTALQYLFPFQDPLKVTAGIPEGSSIQFQTKWMITFTLIPGFRCNTWVGNEGFLCRWVLMEVTPYCESPISLFYIKPKNKQDDKLNQEGYIRWKQHAGKLQSRTQWTVAALQQSPFLFYSCPIYTHSKIKKKFKKKSFQDRTVLYINRTLTRQKLRSLPFFFSFIGQTVS